MLSCGKPLGSLSLPCCLIATPSPLLQVLLPGPSFFRNTEEARMASPNLQVLKWLSHPALGCLSPILPSTAAFRIRPRYLLFILWSWGSPEVHVRDKRVPSRPAQPRMEERRPEEVSWPVYSWRAFRPKDGGRKPGQAGPKARRRLPGIAPGPGKAVAEPLGG